MRFRVVHASDVHPSRRGLWFAHEHSASFTALSMTEARWKDQYLETARSVLQWATGPRWGVVAED